MKASILAVGTELTIGQIVNKNAASISARLIPFGIEVRAHLTVADDRNKILEALNYLQQDSDLIFVTGGLGPTSDDFTREVVAAWTNKKLIFDEASWTWVQERLSSRGFKVRDIQKQQCYFPEGSEILTNTEGTANAFRLQNGDVDVLVLPGPPREIDAVWRAHIHQHLDRKCHGLAKTITRAWDTIGVGESEVAFQVEELLKDRPRDKFFEIGYRVHLPYVEVKLSFSQRDEIFWNLFLDKVDRALSPITVARDFSDVAQSAFKKLSDTDFTFYDFVSGGYLMNRISPYLKSHPKWSFKQSDSVLSADLFENEDDFLALLPFEDDQCVVIIGIGGEQSQKTIEAPMKSPLMAERRKQFFAEMALVELNRILGK